ncbi:MAG: hypothetical protein R3183_00305 [Oleiphilaceae bacterium]|nr:hypothetical protein [Oleiphilaceae bacterium]
MICLSAASVLTSGTSLAEDNPLLDMEFFLFLSQSEQQGEQLTTPLDLDDWEPEDSKDDAPVIEEEAP